MAGSYGYNVRWAMVAAGGTFNSSAKRFPVVRDTIGLDNEKLDGDGTTGTRSIYDALSRDGVDKVAGQVEFNPTFYIFDTLLPYILGGAESVDTFPVADTLPDFDRLKDMGGKIIKHTGLKVSKAELTFAPGLLKLVCDCVGKTEVASGLSWSSAALGVDSSRDRPYAFQDCTVTINSGTRKIRQGVLTIDNKCEAIYSSGSVTAEEIMPQGSRVVTLASTHPTSSTEYDQLYLSTGDYPQILSGSSDGNSATIALSYTDVDDTSVVTTITLRKLRAPKKTPVFESKGEMFYVPVWQARHDGTNAEISVTNVYT